MTETDIPADVRERAEHFAMECGHPWLAPVFWRCIMADRAARAPDPSDLRAARALIDTPEKLAGRSLVVAIDDMVPSIGAVRAIAMLDAIAAVDRAGQRGVHQLPHAEIMALIDRAIANEEHHDRA